MGEHDVNLHDPRTASSDGGADYDRDWAGWLAHQVSLLKARRFDELDFDHFVDEVESLGRSDFKSFASAVEIVILHMLKWDHQPAFHSRSWALSIAEHRRRIVRELRDSPSYRRRIPEAIEQAYEDARFAAVRETGIDLDGFPAICPYDWDVIMTRPHD